MHSKTRNIVRNLTLGLLALGAAATAAQQWQSMADISAAAEAHVQRLSGPGDGRTTVRAGTLDPRHRLPDCDRALETFMRRGTEIRARTIVGVRCTGSRPWKVYVPVDVVVMTTVYTAKRTLPKGHILGEADLARAERDISRLTAGYFGDRQELIGRQLKQQLIAGRMITPAVLQANYIIRRGQTVTLLAQGLGLNITMTGKSLMDGALNQRIRVENTNSGRVIEGIVRSQEHVEILLPDKAVFFHAKPKDPAARADTQLSNNDR